MKTTTGHTPSQLSRIPDMDELVNDFIQEAITSLEKVEPLVESLGEPSLQVIETNIRILFRTFHSIKGVAGFLQFALVQDLTHEAETLFDTIRESPSVQPTDVLTLIYDTIATLKTLVNEVYQHSAHQAIASPHELHSPQTQKQAYTLMERLRIVHGQQEESENFFDNTTSIEQTYTIVLRELATTLHILIASLQESSSMPTSSITDTVGSILNILNNPTFKTLVQHHDDALSLTRSASVFADMIIAGDLSLNEQVLITLHSQIDSIINILSSTFQASDAPVSASAENTIPPHADFPHPISMPLQESNEKFSNNIVHQKEDMPENIISSSPAHQAQAIERTEIRVETAKLDKLFDLVGELVTMQTMALNSPDLQGLALPQFRKSATMLTKITRQLQSVSMSMRMAPIEILFAKMRRVVREVSSHVGKSVELHVSGADTEMDKNLIELLFDALVHIVRNAIDHGIESPEDRKKAGKAETGAIMLGALYEGNDIIISVRDDGAGLHREKILRRAEERGIVSSQNTQTLSDEEIWKYIFEPGFSTAETITDISGRGVGMDVVRQNIEKLRGQIQVSSKNGIGTTVTLRIPLTLASMDVMLIRVSTSYYAIPLGAVRQSFRPKPNDITVTMDGLEIVRVRETLYPVIRLHQAFHQHTDTQDLTKGILIIIESHNRKACLFVDEVIGQQQTVIKSLSDYIGSVGGLSGCMILSDGHIGLILDPEDLIRQAEEQTTALAA